MNLLGNDDGDMRFNDSNTFPKNSNENVEKSFLFIAEWKCIKKILLGYGLMTEF